MGVDCHFFVHVPAQIAVDEQTVRELDRDLRKLFPDAFAGHIHKHSQDEFLALADAEDLEFNISAADLRQVPDGTWLRAWTDRRWWNSGKSDFSVEMAWVDADIADWLEHQLPGMKAFYGPDTDALPGWGPEDRDETRRAALRELRERGADFSEDMARRVVHYHMADASDPQTALVKLLQHSFAEVRQAAMLAMNNLPGVTP
jgi:hypothetical protein